MTWKLGDSWQSIRVQDLFLLIYCRKKKTVNFDVFKFFQGAIMIIQYMRVSNEKHRLLELEGILECLVQSPLLERHKLWS